MTKIVRVFQYCWTNSSRAGADLIEQSVNKMRERERKGEKVGQGMEELRSEPESNILIQR